MNKAIEIIHDEHMALAAVLNAMLHIVDGIESRKSVPDFELLSLIVKYIAEVPENLHHPKEDQYLFTFLRRKWPASTEVLAQLEKEHRGGGERISSLQSALSEYQRLGDLGFQKFSAEARTFAAQEWRHMSLEEKKVMPLAREYLAKEDWNEIYEAFTRNGNPWQGTNQEYDRMFTRIVSLVPPPLGVGPESDTE
ncbi:MAG: hemerythrin domain-containing protein [Rhodocyclaceae bacterium]|nr:MAG: hemerythrin domain-containing protein [Rhodocyclaceae bacterium]